MSELGGLVPAPGAVVDHHRDDSRKRLAVTTFLPLVVPDENHVAEHLHRHPAGGTGLVLDEDADEQVFRVIAVALARHPNQQVCVVVAVRFVDEAVRLHRDPAAGEEPNVLARHKIERELTRGFGLSEGLVEEGVVGVAVGGGAHALDYRRIVGLASLREFCEHGVLRCCHRKLIQRGIQRITIVARFDALSLSLAQREPP